MSCPRHPIASTELECVVCNWRGEGKGDHNSTSPRKGDHRASPPPAIKSNFSRAEIEALNRLAQAKLARESLYDFVRLAFAVLEPGTRFEDAWYIEALCTHVQRQLEDAAHARSEPGFALPVQNLLINIPPRMLKSRIVSTCASVWAWLHWPTLKIMSLSSNPRVTDDCARDALNLIASTWFQVTFKPTWTIVNDALSKTINSAGGQRVARGLDGRITGEGADWQIIDDPHDARDVFSEAKRLDVTEGYTSAVYGRVQNPSASVRTCIMQRLHEEDFSGACARTWHKIILPMEFDPRFKSRTWLGWVDPRTTPGELLHPARFTRAYLDGERKRLGPFGYGGQYQQDPAPMDGGILKVSYFQSFDEIPKRFDGITISVDAAFKKTTAGSRVSILVMGRLGTQRFLLDNHTAPMDFDETIEAIIAMRAKWPKCNKVLIEDKANGSAIILKLGKVMSGVVACSPGSDSKEGRAMACQPTVAAGSVFIPRFAAWRDDFLHEVGTFPRGAKDDQVDALTQVLIDMEGSSAAERCKGQLVL